MTQQELTQTRAQLYKPTPSQFKLVDELAETLKTIPNRFDVEMTSITFKKSKLVLKHGLSVRMIEIDPQEIGTVLIHWYPKFDVSNTSDPFCSAYVLTPNELKKIIKTLQDVSNYYKEHSKT